MKNTLFIRLIFFVSLFNLAFVVVSDVRMVSLNMETKILSQGKYVTTTAEIFYKYSEGKMVVHYQKPMEYIVISNSKGEAKIYNPKRNEVTVKQGIVFETEKSLFYYFFSNRINDLGLKDLGFVLSNTRFDEGLLITTWKPGLSSEYISKVELVHEKYVPIYVGYYDKKGKLAKKIFYYDYFSNGSVKLPRKVVEFSYLQDGDSIINRTVYSNFRFNEEAKSTWFDFNVPSNAKIVD